MTSAIKIELYDTVRVLECLKELKSYRFMLHLSDPCIPNICGSFVNYRHVSYLEMKYITFMHRVLKV